MYVLFDFDPLYERSLNPYPGGAEYAPKASSAVSPVQYPFSVPPESLDTARVNSVLGDIDGSTRSQHQGISTTTELRRQKSPSFAERRWIQLRRRRRSIGREPSPSSAFRNPETRVTSQGCIHKWRLEISDGNPAN
ncbi:hypothetical protein C8R44DRAFT_734801 [Mycena epipterygia]|nr:hypothetical protein C8R44DRAFT_734801 [Mycena epipterygia]